MKGETNDFIEELDGGIKKDDMVAWEYYGTLDEFEKFYMPSINGEPVNTGYVVGFNKFGAEVRPNHGDTVGTKTINLNRIVGRKEREHNLRYQARKKREDERRQKRKAYKSQPFYKRWWIVLAGGYDRWWEKSGKEKYYEPP